MSQVFLGEEQISIDEAISAIVDLWNKRRPGAEEVIATLSPEAQERLRDAARNSVVQFLILNLMPEEERREVLGIQGGLE